LNDPIVMISVRCDCYSYAVKSGVEASSEVMSRSK